MKPTDSRARSWRLGIPDLVPFLAALVTVVPSPLPAQSLPSSAQDPPAAAQDPPLGALTAGMIVRVQTTAGRRAQGTLASVDSTALVLRDREGVEHRLPVDGIRTIHERVRSTHRLAAGGAIAGAAGFGGAVALLAAAYCESSCSGEPLRGFLVGAPLGALGGAAFGALAGSLFRHWAEVEAESARPAAESGWSVHLGLSRPTGGRGPAPSRLVRGAVHRRLDASRLGFLELSHLAHDRESLEPPPSTPVLSAATRDAGTWTVAVGVAQEVGGSEHVRLNASVGLARSAITVVGPSLPEAGDAETNGVVQYSSRLSGGLEAAWSIGSDAGLQVGIEGRYDYIPLFLDGIQLMTLSLTVRG